MSTNVVHSVFNSLNCLARRLSSGSPSDKSHTFGSQSILKKVTFNMHLFNQLLAAVQYLLPVIIYFIEFTAFVILPSIFVHQHEREWARVSGTVQEWACTCVGVHAGVRRSAWECEHACGSVSKNRQKNDKNVIYLWLISFILLPSAPIWRNIGWR